MIEQSHRRYVPAAGTQCKRYLCPTGVLGALARAGHIGSVLPNNINKLRKERRLSQEALAAKVGTTRNQLIKLEQGSRPLSSDWLERLGAALDVPPYMLIAPDNILPNEGELAQMLADAQQTLPAGLPYSEWPRAVAAGLHMRLRTIAGDRATADV